VPERAFAAEKLANILQGGNRRNFNIPMGSLNSATVSLRDAANMLGVSPGSVARARVIHINGTDVAHSSILVLS
jgi:hypothetical protein